MPSQRFTRALVTGASSGIGEAIARQLAADGVELVVVARSTDRLQALADELDVKVEVITADLTDDDDVARVAARLEADPPIDLLVNNAGFGSTRDVAKADLDVELAQIAIHVRTVVALGTVAARVMRERGAGGILNVSSVGSFYPLPGGATYAASKAFQTSWTQALHMELQGTGVHASVLCPGFVDTPMLGGDPQLTKLPSAVLLSAESVARAGLKGVAGNDPVVVPGMAWKAATSLTGVLPRPAIRAVLRGTRRFS